MRKYLCLFDRDMTTWNRDGATRNSYNASYYNYYAIKQYGGIYGDIPATSLTVGNRYYAHIILSESNNNKTRVQVRMDVNTFNMDDTCSSSDDTRCSQCFDLASGDDFRFLFVQSTATSGWGNTNVKEAYLIDVTEDTEGMTLAEAKTWCDANIETSQVVDTVEELTEEYETSITNSIGQQYTSTQAKFIPKTLSSSIGYQSNTAFNKNINATLSSSIGYNYTYLVFEPKYGTASSSIGFQFNLTPTKNINQALSSSAGDRYTLTFDNDFVTSLSNSIGYQSNLEFIHNINYGLSNSIGYQSNLEYSKLEVEGITHNNLQPYIVVYRYRRTA